MSLPACRHLVALLLLAAASSVMAHDLATLWRESDAISLHEPRIVLSPHIGGVTADAYVKMGVAAASNALAVLIRADAQAAA